MMIIKKEPKTPLRYAGGKSRGVSKISSFIPQETKAICSPFFGGGSVELACANNDIFVSGYDNFKPLVEFWQCLLSDRIKLASIVRKYYPLPKTEFYNLKKVMAALPPTNKYVRAAIFYVLNRCSFSGTTMSGGMSPDHPRFTESSIERLSNFSVKNIQINHADFNESIKLNSDKLLYLDPPYMIESYLYGTNGDMHTGFDHEGLSKILHRRKNWILSYNDCKHIHSLYDGYCFHYPEWKYGMSSDKKSREMLIFSDDLAEKNNLK